MASPSSRSSRSRSSITPLCANSRSRCSNGWVFSGRDRAGRRVADVGDERARAHLPGLPGELLVLVGGERLLGDDRAGRRRRSEPSPVPSGSRRLCSASESGASSSQNVARTGSRPPLMPNRRHTRATLSRRRSRGQPARWRPRPPDAHCQRNFKIVSYRARHEVSSHRLHSASAGHRRRPDPRRRRRHRDRRRRVQRRPGPAAASRSPRPSTRPPARPTVTGISARITFTNNLIASTDLQGSDPILTGASGRLWLSTTSHRMRLELQGQNGDAQVVVDNGAFSIYDPTSNTVYKGTLPSSSDTTARRSTRARSRPWRRSRPS